MATKDKDYRLITLITDVCPLPLRKLFLKLAQSDTSPGVPFTTLDVYMTFRKHDVEKLMKLPPKSITKAQYNLIYPNADETKWDVSLLSGLLLGLFRRQMSSGEDSLITIIRDIRNKRQHKPGNVVTTDSEFDTVWNDIETATLTLALIVEGSTYEDEVSVLINEVRTNNLPRLGDTLRSWYEDIIVELRNEIKELKETSNRSLGILEATTVKRKSSSGGKSKRQKIDDPVLNKLRGQFEKTLERELPEDFEPHAEESAIRQALRDKHYVVVSGYENTSYLATVLSAITTSDHLMSRCVEMKKLDDWRHVDPEETDLVLYCEPFQDCKAIEKTGRELHDMFQSMQDSATMSDRESRVDVVIVSEHTRLEAWKEQSNIKLFEDIIELYRPTEAGNPLDLEKGHRPYKSRDSGVVLGNMIAHSEAYIQQCKTDVIDEALINEARKKFKQHKAVVITGPKGTERTRFALNLVSSLYDKNQCVVFTEASDWKHVSLGEVSVIIIDEFAGKFKYNTDVAESWLTKFDLIYAAVVQGKLNVILTCETKSFAKLFKTFGGHALLNNSIKLPARGLGNVIVKEEPASPDFDHSDSLEIDKAVSPNTSRGNDMMGEFPEPDIEELPECKSLSDINIDVNPYSFCEMSDGTVVCCYNKYHEKDKTEYYITKFNMINGTMEDPVKLAHTAPCISFVEGHEIVIFIREGKKMQYATVGGSGINLGEIVDIPVPHFWNKAVCIRREKYILCTNVSVFIYDQNWKLCRDITHDHTDTPLFYFGFPTNDSRISKRRHITDMKTGEKSIVISSNVKYLILNFHGDILQIVEVGAESIHVYNEHLIFTQSDHIISIYSFSGKFKKTLLQNRRNIICFFYGRKSSMLFIRDYNGQKLCSIENTSQ